MQFERPRRDVRFEDCFFYHVCDLPGVGRVGSEWDLRATIDAYLGQVELSGRRVLDVGAASGFVSFEAERRGATVVSFDLSDPGQYQFVPYWQDEAGPEALRAEWSLHLERLKNAYWFCHRQVGASAQVYYGNVYELPAELGEFDVVLLGTILPHLRDPCRALESAARLSRDAVVVTQGYFSDPRPTMALIPSLADPLPQRKRIAWWHMSDTLLASYMAILGFRLEQVIPARPLHVAADPPEVCDYGAFVFRRGRCDDLLRSAQATGLDPLEGPYAEHGMPNALRWMVAPRAEVGAAVGPGMPRFLKLRVLSFVEGQSLRVRSGERVLLQATLGGTGRWENLSSAPFEAKDPSHTLVLEAGRPAVTSQGERRPLFLALDQLDLCPAAPAPRS